MRKLKNDSPPENPEVDQLDVFATHGRFDDPLHQLRLGDALDRYERLITPRKKGVREERSVLKVLRRHAAPLMQMHLEDVRPRHIAAYRDHRRGTPGTRVLRGGKELPAVGATSPTTVRKELCLLSDVFNKARLEWGYETLQNPVAKGLRPRPASGRVRRVTEEEREKLLAAAREYELSPSSKVPISLVIDFALESAMRLGEIAGIDWAHVDFERRTVFLRDTKNGSCRNVPLKPSAVEILIKRSPASHGSVWGADSESIRTAWNRVVRRSKVPNLRFHDLRHEAISQLIESADVYGLSLPEIMYISGHKTMSMLARYFHALAPKIATKLARRDERQLSR